MVDLSGQVVALTGGAQGIGRAASMHLATLGAQVVMMDLHEEPLRATEAEIRAAGGTAHGLVVDVRDDEALRAAAQHIESQVGPVCGLVTLAGTTCASPSETMTKADWRRVLDVNLDGTFFACQAFGAAMLERRRGSIVTISSVSGLGGQSGRANYVASKWAVIGLTKTLAIEWGQRGVRVNCVCPGPVQTALFDKLPKAFREEAIYGRTPLGRAAQPSELAPPIAFLLSEDAGFVTGAVLSVDGGYASGYSTVRSGADLAS